MKEMSPHDWFVLIQLLIGSLGAIGLCVLGIINLHKRAGCWPWEMR